MSPAEGELEKIYETADESLIPVVDSLLRGAGIEFYAKNRRLHSTVPGTNFLLGPVEYWVNREVAAEARELLKDLT